MGGFRELVAWWKQSEEYGWLQEVHSQVLQQGVKDLERAYTNLFAGRTAPPRYRKKFLADSFRYPQGVKLDGRQVYLPMIGWVEFWDSRPIEGMIKNVTVSRDGTHQGFAAWGLRRSGRRGKAACSGGATGLPGDAR